jgi:hypothetical protein
LISPFFLFFHPSLALQRNEKIEATDGDAIIVACWNLSDLEAGSRGKPGHNVETQGFARAKGDFGLQSLAELQRWLEFFGSVFSL